MSLKERYEQISAGLEPKKNIEAVLAAKAWDDPDFKQELMDNPREVMNREIEGFDSLSDDVTVSIIEEQPDTLYFVLPSDPVPAARELSDEELEVVAGGREVIDDGGSSCCVSNISEGSCCCETL